MQAFKVILLVACLAGVASTVSSTSNSCERCKNVGVELLKGSNDVAACEHVPDKAERDKCFEYVVELTDILTRDRAEKICQIHGKCTMVSLNSHESCELCEKGAERTKKNLPKLEESLLARCKQYPSGAAQDKCIADAKTDINKLPEETPKQICQDLDNCPKVLSTSGARESCKDAEEMRKSLPKMEESMIAACKRLPGGSVQNNCIAGVEELIKKMSKESPPEQVCQDASKRPKVSSPYDRCEQCKEWAEELSENLPEAEETMMGECKQMTDKAQQSECIAYAKELINMMSKYTPEKVCRDLGQCPGASLTWDRCGLCKKEAEKLKRKLAEAEKLKQKLAEAEELVIAVCQHFPTVDLKNKCIASADRLIDMMPKETPEQTCQEVGLCPKISPSLDQCELCKKDAEETKEKLPRLEVGMIAACKQRPEQAQQNRCIGDVKYLVNKISDETPEQSCQGVSLCPKNLPFVLRDFDQSPEHKSFDWELHV